MLARWIGACVGVLEGSTCFYTGSVDAPEGLFFTAGVLVVVALYVLLALASDAVRSRREGPSRTLAESAVQLARRGRR